MVRKFTYVSLKFKINVGNYAIHGSHMGMETVAVFLVGEGQCLDFMEKIIHLSDIFYHLGDVFSFKERKCLTFC